MLGGIVGELSDRKPGSPVIMQGVDVSAENLLDGAMSNLCLTVSLGVVSSGEIEGGTEAAEERLPELSCDARVPIRDDELGQALQAVHVLKVQMSQTRGRDCLVGANKEGLLGEHVDKGGDGVISLSIMSGTGGQICYQVHADMRPRALRDGMGLQEARRSLSARLDALTGGAGGDVATDGLGQARPPVVLSNGIQGAKVTRVASGGRVMEIREDAGAESIVSWHTNAVTEVVQTVSTLGDPDWKFGGKVEGVGGIGGGDGGGQGRCENLEGGAEVKGMELAREGVSTILFSGQVADFHVGLEVHESLKPASLAARQLFLPEEILEGVMVGVQSEMLAAFKVMAEDLEGMYDSQQFQLMHGVVGFCRRQLATVKADGMLVLLENSTQANARSVSVQVEGSSRASQGNTENRGGGKGSLEVKEGVKGNGGKSRRKGVQGGG